MALSSSHRDGVYHERNDATRKADWVGSEVRYASSVRVFASSEGYLECTWPEQRGIPRAQEAGTTYDGLVSSIPDPLRPQLFTVAARLAVIRKQAIET